MAMREGCKSHCYDKKERLAGAGYGLRWDWIGSDRIGWKKDLYVDIPFCFFVFFITSMYFSFYFFDSILFFHVVISNRLRCALAIISLFAFDLYLNGSCYNFLLLFIINFLEM